MVCSCSVGVAFSWERSQFPDFFDLKLREAVSHGLLSFDCYNLRSVLRQLGVDRLTRFAGQQINFSISSFDSSGLPIPDANLRALGVLGTTQVGGDVTSHIEHFASHENFLRTQNRTLSVLRPLHQQRSDTDRNED